MGLSQDVVDEYLNAVAKAGIDYVELGLRNFPKKAFLGAYAYTTEQHLNELELPEGPIYGVMVDAKTLLTSGLEMKETVDALFVPASQSKISFVRIAAHFHEVEASGVFVRKLKELGYMVGYNLMQSAGKPDSVITEKAVIATSWETLDVLYFADSLGNMDGREVERIINALRKAWNGPLGIHTHDNMSKGLDNSMVAQSLGVDWLDATITGMGRGAGNTQTERLLAMLESNSQSFEYNSKPIYDLVIRHFESMQKSYGWGTNLLYFLGAQNNVHPTYIQNLLSNSHYGTDEIVGAIGYLSNLDGSESYDGEVLNSAISFNSSSQTISGSHALVGAFNGKEVLLITNAPSTKRYKQAVELYIKEKSPIVISVNINKYIDESLIDYYAISHNVKFLADSEQYQNIKKTIVLPKHRFNSEEIQSLDGVSVVDFGFDVAAEQFSVNEAYVTAPYDLTIAYSLGIVVVGQAEKVNLVGFDGFNKGDSRQVEMLDLFSHYQRMAAAPQLISLTPSSYSIAQGSIYALHS